MTLTRSAAGFAGFAALLLSLQAPAMAADFSINNPADRIHNPASDIKNPAANIYNPAAHMDNPNPLSPPTQPIPQPPATKNKSATESADQIKAKPQHKPKAAIPHKSYYFKSVKTYITAAKKALNQGRYIKSLSISEDALRRINAGTLRASKKSVQTLNKYKDLGYRQLEKNLAP